MKCKSILAVLVAGLILAAPLGFRAQTTQIPSAIHIGWLSSGAPATGTLALNAANTWLALSFRPPADLTIAKVRVYASAVGGTLDGNDLECHIFSNAVGVPNASLSSTATVTATPTGAAWVEFTGLSQAVTGGTQYWIVLKNAAAAPTTNFPTYQWVTGAPAAGMGPTSSTQNWSKKQTSDGSTWGTSPVTGVMGYGIEYSTGAIDGILMEGVNTSITGDGVYSTREAGVYFTSPANVRMRVRGVRMMPANKTGTPTGNLRYRIYTGTTPTLVCTTADVVAPADLTAIAYIQGYCASTITIEPGTIVRVVMSETTQSDTSGNRYNTSYMVIPNTAPARSLTLFGGLQKTYFDGSTWAQTNTEFPPFSLILDTDGPFIALNTTPAGITARICTTP